MAEIVCPNCQSTDCLYGNLSSDDSDYTFKVVFYPAHIQEKTFFTLSSPQVKFEKDQKFYGCYNCGHLWGRLNLFQYKNVIEKAGWQGGEQVAPPPQRSYFWLGSWLIFAGFIGAILFFNYAS